MKPFSVFGHELVRVALPETNDVTHTLATEFETGVPYMEVRETEALTAHAAAMMQSHIRSPGYLALMKEGLAPYLPWQFP